MQYCCICQFSIKPEINIFNQSLGDPPVPIIQIINDCTQDFIKDKDFYQSEIQHSYICLKCSGKLLIYYKASLIMKKIKEEMYTLMENASSKIDLLEKKNIKIVNTHIDGNIHLDVKVEQNKISDDEEDFNITKYVDNADVLIDNVEDELVMDDMSAVLKSEIMEQTLDSNEKLNTYDEIIEIEELNVDEFNESSYIEEQHIKTEKCHSPRQSISCDDCLILFPNKRTYRTHRRQEHFAGYVCDQCGKTFYSQSGFITHRHTHKPVKDFVCSVCGEGYHHKNYLKRHMAWHSGEMPFQCDVCSKRFVHKVALYKHKKIHEDIRNIECSECGFKFRTKAHLNRHMMTHTGAKPHSCPICGKCFSQVYNMKVHVKEHESPGSTRRRRIRCKHCSKTFSSKEKYDIHIQKNEC